VAVVAYYALGSLALLAYLVVGRSAVRLSLGGNGIRWALFSDILRVGGVAALITISTNLTIAFSTAFVGQFGPAAIAGYGTGARLEYLLIPLVFGLGAPLVAMVGTNIGAGMRGRALQTAWIGAAIAAGLCEAIGLGAATFPKAWLGLFDTDPAMLDVGIRYLQAVGPAYGLFGLGMALYFASQGAGRLLWPLLANVTRLIIAAGGGWLALRWSANLFEVFVAQAIALATFGLIVAAAVAGGAWFGRLNWSWRVVGSNEMTPALPQDFAVGAAVAGRLHRPPCRSRPRRIGDQAQSPRRRRTALMLASALVHRHRNGWLLRSSRKSAGE